MTDLPPLTAAQRKWPNVPACHGWLSLDRRGDWRLQDERVTHPGLIAFLNQNYRCDAGGRWFVQNGPQQVFVRLACTPWIIRMHADEPVTHTGVAAGPVNDVFLDEGGSILLLTETGIGLLDDRDLPEFLARCEDAEGKPADEDMLLATMAGTDGQVFWRGLSVRSLAAVDLAFRFKFDPDPQP